MDISGSRIKGNFDSVTFHVVKQTIHPLMGGLQAAGSGLCQTIGGRVDPHHPDRIYPVTAKCLHHQVRSDIPGTDQGSIYFHIISSQFLVSSF